MNINEDIISMRERVVGGIGGFRASVMTVSISVKIGHRVIQGRETVDFPQQNSKMGVK